VPFFGVDMFGMGFDVVSEGSEFHTICSRIN